MTDSVNDNTEAISELNSNIDDINGKLNDFVTRYVSATIESSTGSKSVSITAPTIQGYTFLTWYTAATSGWVCALSFQNPQAQTTNLWKPPTSSAMGGSAYGYALYKRT